MKPTTALIATFLAGISLLCNAELKSGDAGKKFKTDFADALELKGLAIQEDGYHIWGSSPVISDDGKIHIFCSRWSKTKPDGSPLAFDFGWRSPAAEIAHYVGDNPEGPFKFSEIVMQGSGKPTWDRRGICNSTVRKVGDTYAIFYIANAASGYGRGGVGSQRIGLITSKSPY
ncbi:MAG: hypothetical protein ABFR90_11060, partial [Planctomycetota bacterium]